MRLTLFLYGRLLPDRRPFVGYLIQTEDGTNILVDTGFPEAMIDLPTPAEGSGQPNLVIGPEDHVVARLESVGLEPDDIDILVCTHFDRDHAGNHHLFTNAELVVQREHYEAAKGGHPRFQASRPSWDAEGLNYRLVDGDTELVPGVELVETGGHVPGHQSLLIRLPETGPVILAIDAIPVAAALDADGREIYPHDEDEAGTRRSTRKLTEIAEREGVTLMVHGHDAAQWDELRLSPDYYA